MIVTIDGPAGSGKNSAAKLLADRLRFDFLDTGAMYRAVALACLRRGIDLGNLVEVEAELPALQIETPPGKVLLNGEDVSLDIRSPDVAQGGNDKSTSSENRSMTPNTLESDVPPLKSNPAGGSGRVKTRLSVQQTQKSFSIISEVSPLPVPVTMKRSARSAAGSRATSSMTHLGFILNRLADNGRDPVGRVPRVPEEFLELLRRQGPPELRHHQMVHSRLPEMPQCLEHHRTGPASHRELFWGRVAKLECRGSDSHFARPAVRQVYWLGQHLRGQPQPVGRHRPGRDDLAAGLPGQRLGDFIEVRPKRDA